MSVSEKYNLIELLNSIDEFSVPKIQRDYVQGRKTGCDKDLCLEVRSDFINSLYQCLVKDKDKLLDYVYGEQTSRIYKPIDGQQRLTTLFLIHWYVGKREKIDKDQFNVLEKFSYEVRDTSKEFCKSLIGISVDFTQNSISEQIKDSVSYHDAYNYDPTITSMLVVLDDIHKVFDKNYPGGLWDRLKKIRFWCLPLENFGLTDDLFVKMNARGKKLSRFDVFKSDFESCLENLPNKTQTQDKLIEDWKKEIDNSFLDLFWNEYGVDLAEKNLFRTILFFGKSMIFAFSKDSKAIYDSVWEEDESRATYTDIINYVNNNPDVFSKIYNILSNFKQWNEKAVECSLLIDPALNAIKGNFRFDRKARIFAHLYWFSVADGMNKNVDYEQFDRLLENFIYSLRQYDIPPRSYSSSIDNDGYKKFMILIFKLIDGFTAAKTASSVSFYDYLVNSGLKEFSYEIEKIKYSQMGQSQAKDLENLEHVRFLSRNIHNFFFGNTIYLTADVLNDIAADDDLINKTLRIIFSYADMKNGQFELLLMDRKTTKSGRKKLYYENEDDLVTCWKHRLYFSPKAEFGDSIFTSSNPEISGCVKQFAQDLHSIINANQGIKTADAIERLFGDRLTKADFSDPNSVLWYIVKYDAFFYHKTSTTLTVNRRKDYASLFDEDNIYGMRCLDDNFSFSQKHYQPFYKALSGMLNGRVKIQSQLEYDGIEIEYKHPCMLSNGWRIMIESNGNWAVYFPNNIPPTIPINGMTIKQDLSGDWYGEVDCTGGDGIEVMANIINSL